MESVQIQDPEWTADNHFAEDGRLLVPEFQTDMEHYPLRDHQVYRAKRFNGTRPLDMRRLRSAPGRPKE